VLFGNISYGNNLKTDEEVGEVNPGDSIGFSFGLGLSLNERTSMSLSYSHKHVLKSKIDNFKINGSALDIGQLIIGYSFNYTKQTNINLSLNIGVTDDAPDIRLNFRLPMVF
jgi:long-subunit fatty acid transport protein